MLLEKYFQKFYGIMIDESLNSYVSKFKDSLQQPFIDVQAELSKVEPGHKILVELNKIIAQNSRNFFEWAKSPDKYLDYEKSSHIYHMNTENMTKLINKSIQRIELDHMGIVDYKTDVDAESVLFKAVEDLKLHINEHWDSDLNAYIESHNKHDVLVEKIENISNLNISEIVNHNQEGDDIVMVGSINEEV